MFMFSVARQVVLRVQCVLVHGQYNMCVILKPFAETCSKTNRSGMGLLRGIREIAVGVDMEDPYDDPGYCTSLSTHIYMVSRTDLLESEPTHYA